MGAERARDLLVGRVHHIGRVLPEQQRVSEVLLAQLEGVAGVGRLVAGAQLLELAVHVGTVSGVEAAIVEEHLAAWDLDALDVLFVENVGNLVCPTSWDLGEGLRVVLLSVTEGEDKPLKYPTMFRKADLVLLTKVDLLPYLPGINVDTIRANLAEVMPNPTML